MTATTTSINRYHALMSEGDVSRHQALILSMMKNGRDYTRMELSALTRLPINAITGRVFELVKDDRLEEPQEGAIKVTRKCTVTGHTAKVVRLPVADGA
jgi:hypothetical protein